MSSGSTLSKDAYRRCGVSSLLRGSGLGCGAAPPPPPGHPSILEPREIPPQCAGKSGKFLDTPETSSGGGGVLLEAPTASSRFIATNYKIGHS